MASKRVFGIDLGTTYSCISYVDNTGTPVIIPNAEGEMTTPSVVYFESSNNVVIGRTAREHSDIYPDRVVSCVKRSMGDDSWIFACDGTEYKPQEIAAFILRRLAADAKATSGFEVRDVVITCPAYFGINQKEATRQAGELAGLNVVGIIPEPTAAALAYINNRAQEQTVLVYDLGGGTFDITLMRLHGDTLTVLSTGGDDKLGGRNWDEHLVEAFVQSACEQTGALPDELLADQELFQELMKAAETCKKNLTGQHIFRKTVRTDFGKVQLELSRDAFEALTRPLFLRTLALTKDLLTSANKRGLVSAVDTVLLVGGSTYMPHIQEGIQEHFGQECAVMQFRPNQAVAEGAALFGVYQQQHALRLDETVSEERPNTLSRSRSTADSFTADSFAVQPPSVAGSFAVENISTAESTASFAHNDYDITEEVYDKNAVAETFFEGDSFTETENTADNFFVDTSDTASLTDIVEQDRFAQDGFVGDAFDTSMAFDSESSMVVQNIVNVSAKGFGIMVMTEHGERVRTLIYKDDPIPCESTETFGTHAEGQQSIELVLVEHHCTDHGVSLLEPDFCLPLSTATLRLTESLPAHAPVRVIFRLSADGLLTVTAEELTHGTTLFCRVETESLLDEMALATAREHGEQFTIG